MGFDASDLDSYAPVTRQHVAQGNMTVEELCAAMMVWIESTTGAKRFRAGLPAGWRAGDKSGSGDNATANDIAILRPPAAAPILAAVYFTQSRASPEERNAVHADVARLVAEAF